MEFRCSAGWLALLDVGAQGWFTGSCEQTSAFVASLDQCMRAAPFQHSTGMRARAYDGDAYAASRVRPIYLALLF